MKPIIAPSILSADFGYLAKDIEMVNRSEAEWVHIDIMDGVFVPNISFGFPVLEICCKVEQETAGCASDDCKPGEVYSGSESTGCSYDERAL